MPTSQSVASVYGYKITKPPKSSKKQLLSDDIYIGLHVDVRDLTRDELIRFLVFAASVDEELFEITNSHHRKESPFCVQAWNNIGWWQCIRLAHKNLNDFRGIGAGGRKYSSINLESIGRYGSVEFRHSRCVNDKEVLLAYVNRVLLCKQMALDNGVSMQDGLAKISGKNQFWVTKITENFLCVD